MNTDQQVLLAAVLPTSIAKVTQIKQFGTNCIARLGASIALFMLLIITIGLVAPATHAATLLFKSSFGSGVSLSAPYNFSTNGAWQSISGTDKRTGYTWPPVALNSDFSGIQLITVDPITPTTIGNYITNEIKSVTGPKGNLVNEISQIVKLKGDVGRGGSQAPLLINRPWTIGDVNDLYITYWFKHQADLETQLTNTPNTGNWRMQFEFKTGGYNNSWQGDHRIAIQVIKGYDDQLYWSTASDNGAYGSEPLLELWKVDNHVVPVPVDKWFKFEVYWHRSSGSDGRFWAAVDGEVIVDYHGPNMGDLNLPITRIMVNNPYSGGYAKVESHSTGLEIWSGFPCGEGVSCYR